MTPLDRLADVLASMTEGPWTQCSGTDVRVFYGLPSYHSHRMANASNPENAKGIAALRNVADALVAVARAADKLMSKEVATSLDALDTAIMKALGEETK